MRDHIRFILNHETVTWRGGCSRTLLDELRVRRRMTGTKEGCAEGDCGACTVLVGRLAADGLRYETVNSCIRLMGSLDGCHVVTIEHLKRDGVMHPVQQAMIEHHGSQCGFCTPGIVMSLYALWMANADPSEAEIETALQGNLCRCTGYAPIVRAARAAAKVPAANDALVLERSTVAARLAELQDGERIEIDAVHVGDEPERIVVPSDAADLATVLSERPNATIVSGSTDVGLWVAKHMQRISPAVFANGLRELQTVEREGDGVRIGAGVTYSDFAATVERDFPAMARLWHRIGGEQVRNMGTIGGNIANGSPIGDTPPAMIALGATLRLRSVRGVRELPLEEFFVTYGKQDRAPDEFVESVHLPLPGDALFGVHKISKRREEDISTLCGAFRIRLDERGHAVDPRICYGGMAGTPKRATHAEGALAGRPFDEAAVREAMVAMGHDYEPMSDQRASADYRMAVAKNLLLRFYMETQGSAQVLERAA